MFIPHSFGLVIYTSMFCLGKVFSFCFKCSSTGIKGVVRVKAFCFVLCWENVICLDDVLRLISAKFRVITERQ